MLDTKAIAKELWLNYFNQVLYEREIITEKEMRMMASLIRKHCYR